MNAFSLIEQLGALRDPRQEGKVIHKLSDILLLVICAVIAGCKGWEQIADFGEDRLDWLKQYGEFENGTPSDDTIARAVSVVNPKKFQECFIEWIKACHEATNGEVVAIDGKTVRSSYDKSKRKGPIHMVSAFATANGVVLGQIKTEEKSNEITAIPDLLELLEIKGCLVTIDAMGCQREIAKKIKEKKADYLLAVKGNQGRLHAAFEEHFTVAKIQSWKGDTYQTIEKAHGRNETRFYLVSDLFDEFVNYSFDWTGMKTLGVALAIREVEGRELALEDITVRYYISSAELSAKRLAHAIRSHWHIENKLHWKLDVAMKEDDCRIRRGDGAEILAGFRHIAINLLNNQKSFSGGLERKQMKAQRSTSYLAAVLAGQGCS